MPIESEFHETSYERTPQSRDVWSPGYAKSITQFRQEQWYDVYPYSLAIWPHQYSDKIRRGKWWHRRENYACIALELQLEGSCIYRGEKFVETLQPAELYLTLPGSNLRLSNGPEKAGRQMQIIISGGMVRLLVESLGINECRKLAFQDADEFETLKQKFWNIAELLHGKQRESAQKNSTCGYELLLFLAEKFHRSTAANLPPLLTRAVWTMESERGAHRSISALAASLGTSRVTLSRLFAAHLGISPQAYWNKLRMESAIRLVSDTQLSFKEIAEKLGFRNSLYFSTCFRRYAGCTPSEYRQKKITLLLQK